MTNTPKTLTTTEAREYIRQRRGLAILPSKPTINMYQQLGYLTPYTRGGTNKGLQNTYLVSDLDALCDLLGSGQVRQDAQTARRKRERKATLEQD